jgi:hypothetical protein
VNSLEATSDASLSTPKPPPEPMNPNERGGAPTGGGGEHDQHHTHTDEAFIANPTSGGARMVSPLEIAFHNLQSSASGSRTSTQRIAAGGMPLWYQTAVRETYSSLRV